MINTTNKKKRSIFIKKYINVYLIVGLVIFIPIVLATFIVPYIAPYEPTAVFTGSFLERPSQTHFLGTDFLGMDIFWRLLFAPKIDLIIGLAASFFGFIIGVPLGLFLGYFESRRGINSIISLVIMRIMDVIQAFPVFILGLAIVAVTGQSVINVIYVLGFIWIPVFTRLSRSEVLRTRENLFVLQQTVIGQNNSAIIFKHIMPNAISPAITQVSTCIAASILLTAGLSFVGAGVRMPQPELGLMISIGANNMVTGQWWPSLFPGILLCLLVFSLSMIGEGVTISIDPRNWR